MRDPLAGFRKGPDGGIHAFHSGNEPLTRGSIRPFLHLGTAAQAVMRGGPCITLVTLRPSSARRMRDRGENTWRPRRLRDAARTGHGLAVYLNRYEACTVADRDPEELEAISDAIFRQAAPHAHDSLILLDPDLVETTRCVRPSIPIRAKEAHHGTSLTNLLSIISRDLIRGDGREEPPLDGFSLSSSFRHASVYAEDKSKEEALGLHPTRGRDAWHAIEREIDPARGGEGAIATFGMESLREECTVLTGYSTSTVDEDDDGHEIRVLVDDWTGEEAGVSGVVPHMKAISVRDKAKWNAFAEAVLQRDPETTPWIDAMRRLIGQE